MREIAISDIHGCGKEFELLLVMIEPLEKDDRLILLGDYFDRGSWPSLVYSNLLRLKAEYGKQVTMLFGNHDDMLFHYCELQSTCPYNWGVWQMNGGSITESTFSGDLKTVAKWVKKNTILQYKTNLAIYVHAGLYESHLSAEDMIWTRYLHRYPRQPKLLVVGHSQVSYLIEKGIAPVGSKAPYFNKEKNYVDIDNGCAYGDGPLLAFDVANNVAYYSDGYKSVHPILPPFP